MGSKGNGGFTRLAYQGLCVACHRAFIGKGDRCPDCYRALRARQRRKRR